MVLSDCGEIVKSEWLKSFEIRSELSCDEYCIMPNHIHGIVIINENDRIGNIRRDARPCVSTDIATGNTDNTDNADNTDIAGNTDIAAGNTGINIKRLPRSISSFVAGFKSSATKSINQLRHTPGIPVWQPRFHDHIIRDENALNRIRQYIISNPRNWNNDKNFIREGKS